MEETLGKRIIANRKRIGLTQDKLAEKLGVTAQAVSKWENDQSCPDIAMLPRLAEVFGISTDELLGIAPQAEKKVHEAQIIRDNEDDWDDDDDDDDDENVIHLESDRKKGLGFAVWILLTGGILLAANLMQWDVTFWEILWPTALAVFGLFGLFRKFSFFRLGCGLLGTYFLLSNLDLVEFPNGKELLLPVLLVLFGLSLLVDALRSGRKPVFTFIHNGKKGTRGKHRKKTAHYRAEGEYFEATTSFGEDHRRVELGRLAGGEAQVNFGELTLDLTGCDEIADGCRIDLRCSFGEIELRVPRSCRVEHESSTAFASVDFSGYPASDAKTTIILDCSVNFGEISVKYV